MVNRRIIQHVTKEEFEELKLKHPRAVVSKTKDGREKMFLGNRVFVVS